MFYRGLLLVICFSSCSYKSKSPELMEWDEQSDHKEWNQNWFSDVLALHSWIILFVKSFTGSRLEFCVVSSSKFYKYLSSELFLCGSKTSRGCQKLVLLKEAVGSCTTNVRSGEVQVTDWALKALPASNYSGTFKIPAPLNLVLKSFYFVIIIFFL